MLWVVVACVGVFAPSEFRARPVAKWYDALLVNDELDLLHERLRLHRSFVSTTHVFESRQTFTGKAKPLYAKGNLTDTEGVVLHEVTFPDSVTSTWDREHATRRFIQKTLLQTYTHGIFIISDVDEFVDPDTISDLRTVVQEHGCATPKMRFYYYSWNCVFPDTYPTTSALATTRDTLHHLGSVRNERQACPVTSFWAGRHGSYFMTPRQVVTKLNSFAHRYDDFVQAILLSPDPERVVADRMQTCTDLFLRDNGLHPAH